MSFNCTRPLRVIKKHLLKQEEFQQELENKKSPKFKVGRRSYFGCHLYEVGEYKLK
jgi:hypothetical protein